MRRFENKTVVVTGSGRDKGLGQAILQRFADEGANCVVSDLGAPAQHMGAGDIGTTAEMEKIASELRQRGARVATIPCDVRSEQSCEALAQKAVEAFGSLDIWVNNAGIGYIMKPLLETTASEWDAVLGVNLSGAFFGTKAAARVMIKQGRGGRIINIASQAAKSGFPHMAPYTSSKHGMVGLTRSTAIELGTHGITVNAVCPNHVTTGLGAKQNEYFSKLLGFPSVEAYIENMKRKNPLGRPGFASDTAAACAWLASDDAVYVTGESLNVSGGEEMH
ncbi:SDR family NAD(P)-dependent oxidoreductase [Steroidobacter agaridevorans]|uniref:SDR family NAD(P)-dependent oxidoreductase n=1 Tax=Steroidobacter agaridevorans TaxID=2695856 RepID=UPI0013219D2E|nr:SDR family NAD(P)-dependent oxidoreductase [Steroidobacter agaridevorans]GFE87497.1 diacetyl reductase [Steroidobacter agaridevorans]